MVGPLLRPSSAASSTCGSEIAGCSCKHRTSAALCPKTCHTRLLFTRAGRRGTFRALFSPTHIEGEEPGGCDSCQCWGDVSNKQMDPMTSKQIMALPAKLAICCLCTDIVAAGLDFVCIRGIFSAVLKATDTRPLW